MDIQTPNTRDAEQVPAGAINLEYYSIENAQLFEENDIACNLENAGSVSLELTSKEITTQRKVVRGKGEKVKYNMKGGKYRVSQIKDFTPDEIEKIPELAFLEKTQVRKNKVKKEES